LEPQVREEIFKLVQRLFLIPREAPPRAVVFAGIDASVGCNWLWSVAAKLLATSVPGSVCLMEGNLRSPSLNDALESERDHGLVDALRADGPIREFTRQLVPDNLWLLPAGARAEAEDSAVLLNSDRMRARIKELRKEFDYLLVNAAPLSAFADGMVLGGLADGVVLVLEANSTRREAAVHVTENLRSAHIPVLGAVLNNRTFPIPSAVYKRL
jgi:Mrp family chromosome partitioning ATPase